MAMIAASPALAFVPASPTGSLLRRPCPASAAVTMSASQGLTRREIVRSASVFAASSFILRGMEVFAEEDQWIQVEDPNGKAYWYNPKTQKTSSTDPSKGEASSASSPKETSAPASGAFADVKVTKMGGLLTPFKDVNKGYQIFRPSGWNQFDSSPGEYDVKWEDLVEKSELVMVGSSAVKSATDVKALGTVDKVGASLAAKKKAELVEAKETERSGIRFYTFIFKAGDDKTGAREVYQLCVNKGKLWSVTATTAEKRWNKRKELYSTIFSSFMPKL